MLGAKERNQHKQARVISMGWYADGELVDAGRIRQAKGEERCQEKQGDKSKGH